MELTQMIADLKGERDRINQVILSLEGLSGTKRRGRPKKIVVAANAPLTATATEPTHVDGRSTRKYTHAERKAIGERVRKMWAEKRALNSRISEAVPPAAVPPPTASSNAIHA